MSGPDEPLEAPPGLSAEEVNEWWRGQTFDMATQELFEQGPVRLLEHVVEVSGIAKKARWRDPRKFRRQLLKNVGGNQENRRRQPFASVSELASEYVKHALRDFNARADGSDVELSELVRTAVAGADELDAAAQRDLAREVVGPMVEFHARRLGSQAWRIGHAMRALLAGLDPEVRDDDRWVEVADVADEEWQRSLDHYQGSYALFLSMLPAMQPRNDASIDMFSRSVAWLTEGYGVRVAVEEVSSRARGETDRRAHVDTLSSAVRALMDEHFEFVDRVRPVDPGP